MVAVCVELCEVVSSILNLEEVAKLQTYSRTVCSGPLSLLTLVNYQHWHGVTGSRVEQL